MIFIKIFLLLTAMEKMWGSAELAERIVFIHGELSDIMMLCTPVASSTVYFVCTAGNSATIADTYSAYSSPYLSVIFFTNG